MKWMTDHMAQRDEKGSDLIIRQQIQKRMEQQVKELTSVTKPDNVRQPRNLHGSSKGEKGQKDKKDKTDKNERNEKAEQMRREEEREFMETLLETTATTLDTRVKEAEDRMQKQMEERQEKEEAERTEMKDAFKEEAQKREEREKELTTQIDSLLSRIDQLQQQLEESKPQKRNAFFECVSHPIWIVVLTLVALVLLVFTVISSIEAFSILFGGSILTASGTVKMKRPLTFEGASTSQSSLSNDAPNPNADDRRSTSLSSTAVSTPTIIFESLSSPTNAAILVESDIDMNGNAILNCTVSSKFDGVMQTDTPLVWEEGEGRISADSIVLETDSTDGPQTLTLTNNTLSSSHPLTVTPDITFTPPNPIQICTADTTTCTQLDPTSINAPTITTTSLVTKEPIETTIVSTVQVGAAAATEVTAYHMPSAYFTIKQLNYKSLTLGIENVPQANNTVITVFACANGLSGSTDSFQASFSLTRATAADPLTWKAFAIQKYITLSTENGRTVLKMTLQQDQQYFISALMSMGSSLSLLSVFNKHQTPLPKERSIQDLTFDDIANGIGTQYQRIVVLTGAGISVNAGIPDFRSPGTGIYSRIPKGENIFTLSYLRKNPQPFFAFLRFFVKKSFGEALPTRTHYFIRLLWEKGFLLREYTQNVDGLEFKAGIPSEYVVEAHGTVKKAHCIDCSMEYSFDFVLNQLSISATSIPTCTHCSGIVKPDVVLFGESLFPNSFFTSQQADFSECDLVIVLGTSLVVQPFASLFFKAPYQVPRLVISKQKTIPDGGHSVRPYESSHPLHSASPLASDSYSHDYDIDTSIVSSTSKWLTSPCSQLCSLLFSGIARLGSSLLSKIGFTQVRVPREDYTHYHQSPQKTKLKTVILPTPGASLESDEDPQCSCFQTFKNLAVSFGKSVMLMLKSLVPSGLIQKHQPEPEDDTIMSFMYISDCDEAIDRICMLKEWDEELNQRVAKGQRDYDRQKSGEGPSTVIFKPHPKVPQNAPTSSPVLRATQPDEAISFSSSPSPHLSPQPSPQPSPPLMKTTELQELKRTLSLLKLLPKHTDQDGRESPFSEDSLANSDDVSRILFSLSAEEIDKTLSDKELVSLLRLASQALEDFYNSGAVDQKSPTMDSPATSSSPASPRHSLHSDSDNLTPRTSSSSPLSPSSQLPPESVTDQLRSASQSAIKFIQSLFPQSPHEKPD
ncbi:putative NAD-dependent deacetylase sir2A [Blattamonas nauphoetae]|uniref:NAD-dependent deacetylase sir2A n=1 Tax=Blattamonas nauphoetae TaxID=2049346 RepID=A0ABQ9XRQ4_9EUKA|nr:putative NAD-dependent deacetylase sir2A [Blattamonas nauphoetae]